MKQDCTQGSLLKKGDVVRVVEPKHSRMACVVETPSSGNDRWYVANDDLEKVNILFPKHFNDFKHSY